VGDTVEITTNRNGRQMTFTIRLAPV
jgi:hypothetical protein